MSPHRPHPGFAGIHLIGTIGRYAVEAALHEVELADHSRHAFHHVRDPGEPAPRSMFLRALRLPDDCTYIVDLRHLAPGLRLEFPGHFERDRPGLVTYSLRGRYPSAGALQRAVIGAWKAFGRTDPRLDARAA